jgi:hypothetical protein
MNTTDKGEIARYLTVIHLMNKKAIVSMPVSENCSYDLIADMNSVLYRIQIKKAQVTLAGLKIKTHSVSWSHNHSKTYNSKIIDWLIGVDIDNNKFYLLDYTTGKFDGQTSVYLRFLPTKNNKTVGIRYAKDYEF